MSRKDRKRKVASGAVRGLQFAALGDATRLGLVAKLCTGELRSISQLTEGSGLTRQAVTKHLRVLEKAGLVRCSRQGRESVFVFERETVDDMRAYLKGTLRQWDERSGRLKALVEK